MKSTSPNDPAGAGTTPGPAAPTEIRALKASLRRQLLAEWDRYPAEARARDSEALCRRLRGDPRWQGARAVLLFAPMGNEPDIWPLLGEALAQGKTAFLPRYVAAARAYEARRVADPDRDVRAGHYGVREPRADCPECVLNKLDFVLVPGVGFDLRGWRLGRGKGYYDRLLAPVGGWTCGIAFDWQVVPVVPAEPHDVRLNCILTPTRWLVTGSDGRF